MQEMVFSGILRAEFNLKEHRRNSIYDEVMGTYIDCKKVLFCKHLCRCFLNGVIKSGLCFQTLIWQNYNG